MIKIISHGERCCGTCEKWFGGRVMGECGYVYTLEGMPGRCLTGCAGADVSGSCAAWALWRLDEVCCPVVA